MAENRASTLSSDPPSLAQVLRGDDPKSLEANLLEWIYQDRELAQAQSLLDQQQLSPQQAALLYYWLYMIELVIAGNARDGRRWLDHNSHFRLQLASVLLRLTRQHAAACNEVYSWRQQAPLQLTPHRVESLIRARECQHANRLDRSQRAA